MTLDENKGLPRDDGGNRADRAAGPGVPGGQHVHQRRRDRLRRAAAAGREAARRAASARASSYTLSSARGNTSAQRLRRDQLPDRSGSEPDLNEGPSDFDRRHNFVVSGRMLVPYTHGMTFSWVARALSGLPFTLTNNTIDVDRNGTLFDPIAAGTYTGAGTDRRRQLFGGLRRQAQRRARPRLLPARHALRLAAAARQRPDARCVGRRVQPHQPRELREPERQPGAPRRRSWCSRRCATARRRERFRSARGSASSRASGQCGPRRPSRPSRFRHPACSYSYDTRGHRGNRGKR